MFRTTLKDHNSSKTVHNDEKKATPPSSHNFKSRKSTWTLSQALKMTYAEHIWTEQSTRQNTTETYGNVSLIIEKLEVWSETLSKPRKSDCQQYKEGIYLSSLYSNRTFEKSFAPWSCMTTERQPHNVPYSIVIVFIVPQLINMALEWPIT